MPLNDTLIEDEDDAEELVPQQSAMKRIDAPRSARLRSFELSDDAEMQLKELARSSRSFQTTPEEQPKPTKPLGFMGTIKEGAKGTLRALGATADTMQGDAQGVVEAAKEQAAAPKDADLERFYAHIEEQRKALGENPSLWEGIKAVGGAAIDNPRGFGLMIAEQLPNSGAALGAAGAGALAGSFAGPVGAAVGGLAGLATANIGLETGHKALEAAQDNEFTPEEQSRVRREGLVKGGVITGVDAATLGVTKFITNTSRRAVERATAKALADNGVDITNAAARRAAMETPEIAESVKAAQELAKQGAETLGKRIATTGGAIALETIGEGAGEYLGELAATGKANALDAVIEGFAGLGTSIGEIAATGALNRKGLSRLLDSQEAAEKTAETETKETGVEHEAIPHPTEPEKFVAVPKVRAVAGIDLERDAEGNLKPVQPVSTQADFNLANKQAFEHTAEDRIRAKDLEKQRDEAYAQNPIIVTDKAPSIAGKPATELSNSALEYTLKRGGEQAKKIAQAEIDRRKRQGIDPAIANALEKPADTVKRIITTGAEKAREEARKSKSILAPIAAPNVQPAAPMPAATSMSAANLQVVLPDNTSLPAQWDVVDADSVKATIKEGKNQPRDRSRAASDIQVQGIANAPDYRRLADSPVMDVGAPTLSHDGLIVGGNGRFEGLSRAYDQGSATQYLANLKADAQAKGIDPAKIDGMKKPVLVRRITQPFDVRKLAIASNSGTGLQYSGMELAKIDAERMQNLEHLEITDSGDIALTGSNLPNIRNALSGYSAEELGALVDKDGRLSQEGIRRIRGAMLYSAYGSNSTLERLVESTDNDLRNISGALVKAAPAAAKARADIKAGRLPKELDISEQLVGAVETLSKIRAQGQSIDEYLSQSGLFGEEINGDTKEVLRVLEANIRSQRKIADFIRTYYDSVSRIDTSTDDIFGAKPPTKPELLKDAKERITEKEPETTDLFTKPADGAGKESAKQSPDNGGAASGGKEDKQKVEKEEPKTSSKPTESPKQTALKAEESVEQKIRNTVRGVRGLTIGSWNPITVTHNGVTRHFLANIKRVSSNGRDKPAIHLITIRYGKLHSVLPGQYLADSYKLNKNDVLTEEGLPGTPTDATLRVWRNAGFPIKGEPKQESKSAFKRSTPKPNSPSRQRTESVVKTITAKWKNAPEIVIVDDMNDPAIPKSVRDENARQLSQGATGEPEGFIAGNKVHIVASQMNTPGDVVRVLLHESLGHFGLRGVFGQDLNKILTQVAGLRKRDIEAKAKQYGLDASKEADRLIAAEEVLAELAQNNPQNTLVQRAFAAIRKWLRDHIPGFGKLTLSDAEIIETILTPARRFVQEERTGARTASASVAFSRSSAFTSAARDRFEKITDSLIYNFQDRFKPLKDIQKRAGPVTEDEDASLAEERYSGMVRARTDTFQEQMRDPLMKAIHDSKVAYEDVEKYLHALHAPSRNAAMREINPTEAELKEQIEALEKQRDSLAKDKDVSRFLKERRDLRQAQADIEDGIADESLAVLIKQEIAQLRKLPNVKDYAEALDKLKALRLVKPFRGDNTALSGMSDKEAKAILDKADKDGTRKALDKVSSIVDAITSRTRQIYVEGGLEKADAIDAWNNKYAHYVPLHRDEVSGNTMPKVGQGFNIRGKESKRATGSTKDVTNILAHVVAQHEAAIIRSEKAKVDRALFQFAKTHPDPSLWTLDNAPMLRTVDPVTGFVVERVDPTYKNRPEVLTLKIDGEEHTITFNEQNQEAMRLAASMKNLSSQELGEVTQMVGNFTRFLATMNTTANPVFVARNFLRDLQTAYVNLSDTAIADKKREVFRDIPAAIKGMWALSRGKKNSQWAKDAEEFKAEGGQVGWMDHYRDISARADTLKKELAAMQPGKLNASRRALKSWWTIVNDANNAVENGARLSAYVNARRAGLSKAKAASLAKNLTVNFNARGAKSVELNAWYMFMNASIQGSARLIKALSNKQVRKIVAGVIVSGFLMDILARSMAGDDDEDGENDYDQLPEHTKAMNFVFMLDGQPVTIPMPYGYNFFASTGRKVSEMMFRENYSPVKSAADLAAVFLDAFSPTGQAGSALQYVAPTVADPFIQWAENKNFAGNPLRKEQNPFGVPKPEYQMGFKSTSAPAKWLAEALNETTGGNEVRAGFVNVNPAFFDFAVSSIVGGAGRTYLQTVSGPAKALGDDEIQAREIPFANIFIGARPEYQTERKYFEAVKDVELVQSELKTYRQKGDTEMVKQIREEYGAQLRLKDAAETTRNILARLRKRELALDKDDPPNKAQLRKEIEEKKREVMSRFNKRYREAVNAES